LTLSLGTTGGRGDAVRAPAERTIGGYVESVALAVGLALVSVVPVAWALQIGPDSLILEQLDWHPLGTEQVLLLAVGSVIPAGVLGGAIGGLVWTRRQTVAPVVALSVAWITGIVALPLVAAALDIPLRSGIGCLVGCVAHLRDDNPLGGLAAYGETLMTWPFTIFYLVIPGALLLLARRFRRAALWMATWLSAHAVLHVYTVHGDASAIYAVLTLGVVLWTGWLWARDAGIPAFRTTLRRWTLAILPAVVVVGATWSVASRSWIPNVPEDVHGTLVGTAQLHGFNPPDPSDWFPPIVVPRTPEGSGCWDPVRGPAGRLDLCWEGYRDNRETLPGGDYYRFRLIATLHSTTPTTWVAITIQIENPSGERVNIHTYWPKGVLDGPCRVVDVEGMNVLLNGHKTNDAERDVACGRTTAERLQGWETHRVIWTCAGCGAHESSGRQIAIREVVGVRESTVPTWTIFVEMGR
jgi:hypothetical protein